MPAVAAAAASQPLERPKEEWEVGGKYFGQCGGCVVLASSNVIVFPGNSVIVVLRTNCFRSK